MKAPARATPALTRRGARMKSPPKARSAALELEELEAAEPVAVPVPEPDAPELVAAEDVDVAEEDCVAGVAGETHLIVEVGGGKTVTYFHSASRRTKRKTRRFEKHW